MGEHNGLDILSSDFIDEMPMIIVGFDPEGNVTRWNRHAEEATGYSRKEAVSRGITSLLTLFSYPDAQSTNIAQTRKYLRQIMAREASISGREMSLLSGDGSVRYIKWHSHVIPGGGDKGARELILTGIDITDWHILRDTIKERDKYIRSVAQRLRKYMFLDPQTVLFNYRHFMVEFQNAFNRSVEKGSSLCLLLIDLNNFDSVNGTYGTSGGNRVLRELAGIIKGAVDKDHVAARFGGSKFAVLMPGTDIRTAYARSSRLHSLISDHDFGPRHGKLNVTLTARMALGGYPHCEDIGTSAQLLVRVKDKLDEAKKTGAMGVVICSPRGMLERTKNPESAASPDTDSYPYTVEFVNALARAVKSKDCYTQEHSSVMSDYAVKVAESMGMKDSAVRDVMFGSILHDVGKIGIDEVILLKPGPLTDSEYSMIKQHPVIGAEIIRNVRPLQGVVPLVLYHHERYDGSGYLKGLKAEEIPLGARIISLADVFQALTSDRPYRRALPEQKAFSIIKEYSRTYFDPEVVDAFFDTYNSGADS